MHWRLVARTFILRTSIIDDWLVASFLAMSNDECALIFSALYLFSAYINFTEIDVNTVSWENPTRFLSWC